MAQDKQVNLLDFVVLLVKYKILFISVFFISLILSYLAIYFLIDEKYDASATIIPIQESSVSGIAGLLSDFPIDIGTAGFSNTEMSMYNTIIYSRTVLEKVIDKFDLIKVYELDKTDPEYQEKALKNLRNSISASETDDNAYEITIRANSPDNAASITNYLIELLNERIVELKISKSSQNRIFLQERLNEVKYNLKAAEDSLLVYQNYSGMFDAENQVKGILEAYSKLESELVTKQIEYSILKEIMPEDSPQLKNVEIQVDQFEKRISELKHEGQPNSILLSMNNLPQKTINYLRLLREVEINNAILEFVMPLFEQAKFEEQKNIPVLQVVDYAVPPVKRSYPKRVIFAFLITLPIIFGTFVIVLLRENEALQKSEKVKYIRSNLFKYKKNS